MSGILDEEELIKTRPLLFEQRPYNRILKRCTPLLKPEQLPTTSEGLNTYGEELELDFKAFEGVIARIQLLRETNKREVERYEKEKGDILETATVARETLVTLRQTLQLSQREKENKLIYDAIASDILSKNTLKSRDEQNVNIERLNKEIADLEAERDEYRQVWNARRDQFGQIVDQLQKMWAQIKEDKDEQDRREGMSEEEEGEEVEVPAISRQFSESNTPFNISTPKLSASHVATPNGGKGAVALPDAPNILDSEKMDLT
ncbi:unnamed protein product [Tuber melanosporum]|uniref:(Perigord truffle) hypothetical protein n=1 Tax=Tuber melanosporum (strain Mel28) TaxID=656061 RepID=D5GFF8_TUBMM|nr:uncharacterized protein GSTUM_00006872001 [Tuber melanosporum]CAZ83251.1 unnamed protein product [Tuber melanosporum]